MPLHACDGEDPSPVAPALLAPTAKVPPFDLAPGGPADVCLDGTCPFSKLRPAFAAAKPGATLRIAPGLYNDCVDLDDKPIALLGLKGPDGSRPVFTRACSGKAAFVTRARQVVLQGLTITGIRVADRNGACVRLDPTDAPKQVALIDIVCSDSENGVLGSVGPQEGGGSLLIRRSQFLRNGGNNGYAHGLYIVSGGEVVLDDTVIASTKGGGHGLKVGAQRLFLRHSVIAGLDGPSSRAIDFFGGGLLVIRGSVVQMGPKADNDDMIALGKERWRRNVEAVQGTYLEGSTFLYDDPQRGRRLVLVGQKRGPVIWRNLRLVGLTGSTLEVDEEINVSRYASRSAAGLPPYDGTLASLPATQH
ncbi:MAG: right-handed parallel beta-helix repeat-containing protein [Pseudomonadota bacterium]